MQRLVFATEPLLAKLSYALATLQKLAETVLGKPWRWVRLVYLNFGRVDIRV